MQLLIVLISALLFSRSEYTLISRWGKLAFLLHSSDKLTCEIFVHCIAACVFHVLLGMWEHSNLNGEKNAFTSRVVEQHVADSHALKLAWFRCRRELNHSIGCASSIAADNDHARLNISTLVRVRKAIPCAHCHAHNSYVLSEASLMVACRCDRGEVNQLTHKIQLHTTCLGCCHPLGIQLACCKFIVVLAKERTLKSADLVRDISILWCAVVPDGNTSAETVLATCNCLQAFCGQNMMPIFGWVKSVQSGPSPVMDSRYACVA